jgi:CRP-like cAMP-binding protein
MKTIDVNDRDFMCDLQAPCFQALAPEEMELVKASKTQVQFRKGDNMTKQGTFASYILFVVTGYAIQYIEDESSKSYNIRVVRPGEFVGLSSVFSNNTYDYSSKAISDCQAILVDKNTLAQIITTNGAFGLGLFQRYSEKNAHLYETLQSVLYKQMNGRFAKALLYLQNYKVEFPEIFTSLSRREIADFAGISTESAVKLLKSFEKDGYLKLNGKDIEILNHASLEEISKRG